MRVFFTASYRGRKHNQLSYDSIVSAVQKRGDDVISLEVGTYTDYLGEKVVKEYPPEELHYVYVRKSIGTSDAVIIETTDQSFQLGHEATLALLFNKPVLCLTKNTGLDAISVYDKRFEVAQYKDESELEAIIQKFLHKVEKNFSNVRMHLLVSSEQKNFMDWYAKKTGGNVSQVLRGKIEELRKENPEYDSLCQDLV